MESTYTPSSPRRQKRPDREEILDRTDLAYYIEGYGIELRPCGAMLLRGRCPFHGGGQERTPSFYVWQSQQRWWCFACDDGGTAIDWLVKTQDVTVAEAFRMLRNNAGVRIVRKQPEALSRPQNPPVPNAYVMSCHRRLLRFAQALERLETSRHISRDVVESALLGIEHLSRFGWYLTVPVMHPEGRGWADVRRHRLSRESDGPKELPYYHEGTTALPYILPELTFPAFALITEGCMDCLAALSIGLPAVTNTCGTSGAPKVWEEHHLALITAPRVVICMDADEPGRHAAYGYWKARAGCPPEWKKGVVQMFDNPTVIDLPDGHDLTDVLQAHGPAYLCDLISQSLSAPPQQAAAVGAA